MNPPNISKNNFKIKPKIKITTFDIEKDISIYIIS